MDRVLRKRQKDMNYKDIGDGLFLKNELLSLSQRKKAKKKIDEEDISLKTFNVNDEDDKNEYIVDRKKNVEERLRLLRELGLSVSPEDQKPAKRPDVKRTEKKKMEKYGKGEWKNIHLLFNPRAATELCIGIPHVRTRLSLRIQGRDSPHEEGASVKEKYFVEQPIVFTRHTEDEVLMTSENMEEDSIFFSSLKDSAPINNNCCDINDLSTCSLTEYCSVIQKCKMWGDPVKIVRSRITSLDIHPSLSKHLVIAGDKEGYIGLWDLSLNVGVSFEIHTMNVNCISFCNLDANKFYSTSHDGTVRCGDISTKVMQKVFCTTDKDFKTMGSHTTWHHQLDHLLYIAQGTGQVQIVDLRTNETECLVKCHKRSVRTVQTHPNNSYYFLTSSGIGECGIWDIRNATKKHVESVSMLPHKKGLTSAFFSKTGDFVLTTCNDDTIKIFNTAHLDKPSIVSEISHLNHTGPWMSVFKAKWIPGRDDTFYVGSMLKPNRIQIYGVNEKKVLYSLMSQYITTHCPVVAVHPSQPLFIGGNASGKIHVFTPYENVVKNSKNNND